MSETDNLDFNIPQTIFSIIAFIVASLSITAKTVFAKIGTAKDSHPCSNLLLASPSMARRTNLCNTVFCDTKTQLKIKQLLLNIVLWDYYFIYVCPSSDKHTARSANN